MPLTIIIVGAGIAGLCAAVALRQAGHSITVLEKSKFAAEIGAALLLSPNGTRVLSKIGFDFQKARGCRLTSWDTIDGITLEGLASEDFEDAESRFGAPLMTVHRVDLHNALLRLATIGDGDEGPKVELLLNTRVIGANADEGTVELADGSMKRADLIVAADGVHSVLRVAVLGPETPEISPTGLNAFRFMIPTKDCIDDPRVVLSLRGKCKGPTILTDTRESQRDRDLIWYDCQGGDLRNFVGVSPSWSQLDVDQKKDSKDAMLREFAHFHPSVGHIIQKATNVIVWPFSRCDPLPRWSRGKILLIGDAAHPMLPFGGQGSNQAIEDTGALRCLFENIEPGESLTESLDLFERVRSRQVARTQTMSQVRVGNELDVREELLQYADPPGSSVPESHKERVTHDYGSDVFEKCSQVLQEYAMLSGRPSFKDQSIAVGSRL